MLIFTKVEKNIRRRPFYHIKEGINREKKCSPKGKIYIEVILYCSISAKRQAL